MDGVVTLHGLQAPHLRGAKVEHHLGREGDCRVDACGHVGIGYELVEILRMLAVAFVGLTQQSILSSCFGLPSLRLAPSSGSEHLEPLSNFRAGLERLHELRAAQTCALVLCKWQTQSYR